MIKTISALYVGIIVMMKVYILFGFGIALCIAGVAYLAAEYIQYLSDYWKLLCLVLTVGMFTTLGKFLQEKGW